MGSFEKKVLMYIRKYRLWQPGDAVTMAVSGGLDSMVLMHVLNRTQPAHGASLSVVTFDHGLRPESATEAADVLSAATALRLPAELLSLDISAGGNLQERARDARNAIFSRRPGLIATGHHSGDQSETILYRLLRGSGLAGLAGMLPSTGKTVRPLLGLTKEELHIWATEQGLIWVEDPSNPASTRGQIRQWMASLGSIRDGLEKTMARTAELLAIDEECLSELAQIQMAELLVGDGIDFSGFQVLHPALKWRCLRALAHQKGTRLSRKQVEPVMLDNLSDGRALQLSNDWRLCRDGTVLRLIKASD